MDCDILQDQLQNLSIVDPGCLPFRPTEDNKPRHGLFDNVPQYLFRVFTPKSQGATDRSWTKSMDARYAAGNSLLDIFTRPNKQETAGMINRHLRWWKGPDDNLVSWTSSLLFALAYIFHLHANVKDGSTFDNIHLCVVDTSLLPEGVFVRDIDLIQAYRSFDDDLRRLESLRSKRHCRLSGYYYFGEYLSQGALNIEGKCQIVSARDIIGRGLYDIRPEFANFENWELQQSPPWANAVIELREASHSNTTERQGISSKGLQAAIDISKLFDPHWRVPMAVSFIALAPLRTNMKDILLAFRSPIFTDENRKNCSPLRTKIIAYDSLPEVQAYSIIMRGIYRDYCLRQLKEFLGEAEGLLRQTIIFNLNENLDKEDHPWAEQGPTLIDVSYKAILQKIRTISSLSRSLHKQLEHRKEK